jgi:hypothetical protein
LAWIENGLEHLTQSIIASDKKHSSLRLKDQQNAYFLVKELISTLLYKAAKGDHSPSMVKIIRAIT